MKGNHMKKASKTTEMRREYDFRNGERGKYLDRFGNGASVIVLDPDVAKVFPDSASANRALRACAEIIQASKRRRP